MSKTAVIAEDEGAQREELKNLLAELWPELVIVAECADGLTAIEAIRNNSPDVIFLDIRMPGVSGLEVARAAGDAHIIFVTAYDDFALRAFDDGAADYVLKPVRRDRMATAVARIRRRLDSQQRVDTSALLSILSAGLAPQTKRMRWISTGAGDTIRMISVDDILAFRSEDKYTCVLTADGSAHIRMPLKELVDQLDPEVFWQIHRSAIVRVSAIRAVRRDEDGHLRILINGSADPLPVSASFQGRFRPM
ncbi:LytR/AlgR family response regulator transcription factor [Asticcacaulis sp.]|uniref:LytR/AlgR family response regulator transcription factor n=1 Tax=Asticcacaulis sp. TaxID=1872648 RepID=UPI003F7C86F7